MGYTLPPPTPSINAEADPVAHAHALIERKSALEAELAAQNAVLTSQGTDMSTPLVDATGFPLAALDVIAVRRARVRIIELRNDLRALVDAIGEALERVHAAAARERSAGAGGDASTSADPTGDANMEVADELEPFARVDGVAPGSPAASAGLRREDLLLQFGHLGSASFAYASGVSPSAPPSALAPLAALVTEYENRPLQIKVRRTGADDSGTTLTLSLTPRKGWGGRGLLGCHIVPCS